MPSLLLRVSSRQENIDLRCLCCTKRIEKAACATVYSIVMLMDCTVDRKLSLPLIDCVSQWLFFMDDKKGGKHEASIV
jgi:hypothetical protein